MNDALARILRTFLQVAAAGGLFEIVDLVAQDVQSPYVFPVYVLVLTVLQNYLEDIGALKPILKPATTPQSDD